MSSTYTKSFSPSLSNNNRVSTFKSKTKNDSVSKKAAIVSKSQFNPQCPVVILKRPSPESKAPSINVVCVDSNTKSISNTSQSISTKVNAQEIKRKSAPKSQPSKSSTLSSTVNSPKPNSSPKGKLALGAEPMSETRSFNKPRRCVRGKPRRNSVSAHNVSNFNLSPEDRVYSPGSLSDDPFNSVTPSTPSYSKEKSVYTSENHAVLFNQDKKNQEALLLLESLLSKSINDLPQTTKGKGSRALSTTREDKKKAMASHLLINLLKPSPGSSVKVINQDSNKFYAGPQFKQAPNISSLPLPPAAINKA